MAIINQTPATAVGTLAVAGHSPVPVVVSELSLGRDWMGPLQVYDDRRYDWRHDAPPKLEVRGRDGTPIDQGTWRHILFVERCADEYTLAITPAMMQRLIHIWTPKTLLYFLHKCMQAQDEFTLRFGWPDWSLETKGFITCLECDDTTNVPPQPIIFRLSCAQRTIKRRRSLGQSVQFLRRQWAELLRRWWRPTPSAEEQPEDNESLRERSPVRVQMMYRWECPYCDKMVHMGTCHTGQWVDCPTCATVTQVETIWAEVSDDPNGEWHYRPQALRKA